MPLPVIAPDGTEFGMYGKELAAVAAAALLVGCGARAASPLQDPAQCQIALFIELYNAKHYGSSEFAEQLKPLVQWYSLKVVDLPKAQKEQSVLLALAERLRTDHPSRKTAAKSCAGAALNDP